MAAATRKGNVLTTGEIAAVCRVSSRTVCGWIDDGHLKGYRIPGSRDRRATADAVEQFLKANGMPVEWLKEWMRKEEARLSRTPATSPVATTAAATAEPPAPKVPVLTGWESDVPFVEVGANG